MVKHLIDYKLDQMVFIFICEFIQKLIGLSSTPSWKNNNNFGIQHA